MKAEDVAQRIPRILKRSAKNFNGLKIVTRREIGIRDATE
jgi:hypothetical protein